MANVQNVFLLYFFPSNLQDVTSAIVSSCAHFFSVMLPSSSLLILDFIKATDGIIISQNMEVIFCILFLWLNILFCLQRRVAVLLFSGLGLHC